MPERTSYKHGVPCYTDLSTSDPAAAQKFYGKVFGWDFVAEPTDAGGEYFSAKRNGKDVGGLMQQQPEQAEMGIPSMWNTYVTVNNLEETLATAEKSGGKIHMGPMKVMENGRMAVVADPVGAVVCLWEPGTSIGAELVNEHGALTWNECQTPDVDKAKEFYGELFGWGTQETDMGPMGSYTVFTLDDDSVAGAMNPPQAGVPPHWGTIFGVDDTDATVATAQEAGANVLAPPMDIAIGRQAVLQDPQGAVFSVISLGEPAK